MFKILREFYAEELPIWNHLIEKGIKRKIATWTRDPAENAERLERYWPLWLQFISGFSKKPLDDNPRMLKALTCMDPEAYAVDAAFKLKQGKSFTSIIESHFEALAALWEALNIHGYALEAAKGEFIGGQTARMALKWQKVDIAKIENAVRKKTAASPRDPVEIASAVGLALSELLATSGKQTPLADNWEIPPGPLGDKIRDILTLFDPSTAQAQDAITGKHRIATTRARDRLIEESRETPTDPTDITLEFDRSGEAQEPEGLQIDISRVQSALTKRQHRILGFILSEPDASDVEISAALSIARNSVINCKKKLRDLLSPYKPA